MRQFKKHILLCAVLNCVYSYSEVNKSLIFNYEIKLESAEKMYPVDISSLNDSNYNAKFQQNPKAKKELDNISLERELARREEEIRKKSASTSSQYAFGKAYDYKPEKLSWTSRTYLKTRNKVKK